MCNGSEYDLRGDIQNPHQSKNENFSDIVHSSENKLIEYRENSFCFLQWKMAAGLKVLPFRKPWASL